MRKGLILFLVCNLIIIGFLVNFLFTLITLLFEDCSADAIHSVDIPAPNSQLIDSRPQLIPKIIHQTWQNETVPEKWREAQQSCLDLHGDYEYKLWTNEKARDFVAKEYPWFIGTYDSYPYPIMRADAIRYFVLAHFGGIYIDLDDGCNRRLDPLLSYRAWVRKTIPTGISNDAMGAVPQHPFFLRVIESLQTYNRNWHVPYITVMYGTGPLFLSVIWKEYIRWGTTEEGRVRVLMPEEYNKNPWSFFAVYKGSSWHSSDAKTIFWMGQHWLFLTVSGFSLAITLYLTGFWIYKRLHLRNTNYTEQPSPWWWPRRETAVGAGFKRLPKHEV
ncbi:nucleotide-diphospho-sugar transferase [Tuber brumale]|nr:nucleotide-diphospho-sugar transferase [Tuber brumale]